MTELEGAVLGVIWSRGTLTAYAVRKRFLASQTKGWAVSEGAIYPAIRRLVQAELISEHESDVDRRPGRMLRLTDKGQEALRGWMLSLDDWMGGAQVDPLRTRVNYLGMLSMDQRDLYLANAAQSTRAALERHKSFDVDPKACHQWALEAAHRGARYEMEARLKWLEELRRSPPPA